MYSTWAEQAWAVFRKDVLLEARSRASLNAMLFFAGLLLLIFSFALGPDRQQLQTVAPGLIWLALIFAGLLAFGRSYQLEAENNAFEGLLLVARHRSAIYLGKLLGAGAVIFLIEIIIVPIMAILYDLNLWQAMPALLLIGLLGILGYAAIGALYGALTMSLRTREVLLPLLLLPVTVPVILGATVATGAIMAGRPDALQPWVGVLVVFDAIFITLGLLTYEYAVGE
ncbi:MAG: heme exporter protein CcmB [Chloroflexota bacterium]